MATTRLAHRAALKDARVNTRLQDIADSLTDVIRMGRGDPDFDTPAHIVQAGQDTAAPNFGRGKPPPVAPAGADLPPKRGGKRK